MDEKLQIRRRKFDKIDDPGILIPVNDFFVMDRFREEVKILDQIIEEQNKLIEMRSRMINEKDHAIEGMVCVMESKNKKLAALKEDLHYFREKHQLYE